MKKILIYHKQRAISKNRKIKNQEQKNKHPIKIWSGTG